MQGKSAAFGGVLLLTIIAVGTMVAIAPSPVRQVGESGNLLSFGSYSQMQSFLKNSASNYQYNYEQMGVSLAAGAAAPAATSTSAKDFTTTNVQVQGVDEPDLVKTDGTYLYVATGTNVTILLVNPASAPHVVAKLHFGGQVQGLFMSSGRLLVILGGISSPYGAWSGLTSLVLYDVSDPSAPHQMKVVSVRGNYVDSRLTGGFVYAILQQPSYLSQGNGTSFEPPAVIDGNTTVLVTPSSTFYDPVSKVPVAQYTIVLTLAMSDGSHTQEAVLTGWGSTIYATSSNIYLAFPDRMAYPVFGGVALPAVGAQMMPVRFWWGWGTNTTIFRISVMGSQTEVAAQATIPGSVLNQFSLDEFNGYLRVATTSYSQLANRTQAQVNNVYVLDSGLKVVGALEGLAPNEKIYSVRFLGDVGYVVTFERIDPLFAISFSDPFHPTVLSALKLTGFSDYLQPMGNGNLLGVGMQTVPAPHEQGYVLYLGVKVSTFHVEQNGSSSEVSSFVIGDRGSSTPVSGDHRAFVYDSARGIVAFPVYVALVDNSTGTAQPWDYGKGVWQGAYLFHVDSQGVLEKVGDISQIPSGVGVDQSGQLFISRIVLIGNFVYTISNSEVQVNGLADMSLVTSVSL